TRRCQGGGEALYGAIPGLGADTAPAGIERSAGLQPVGGAGGARPAEAERLRGQILRGEEAGGWIDLPANVTQACDVEVGEDLEEGSCVAERGIHDRDLSIAMGCIERPVCLA